MGKLGMVKLMAVAPLLLLTPAHAATTLPPGSAATAPTYLIGAGDDLRIFVWKNPDLSVDVPVRPDGKISTPLVPDIQAQGKTPTELARDLRAALSSYVQDPVVTVLVRGFAAPQSASSIRVIGAAVTPKSIAYHEGITALDVLIEVGGLNSFADGNDAELIRMEQGKSRTIQLHLANLLKDGDMAANMKLMPGDVIRIPERWF
ncbi:MAG TPA: XrtA/PEP-CTERM system exopolysaccharide export protein [Rhizomicrobium sp.]|nr:XrtA/PEP-CTERM system exopolysaccharide export protein [Rhizomicrobium sp.]